MPIMLQDVLRIENLRDYKIHFAVSNHVHQPLDVFTRDRREWQKWQEYRGQKDEFNRQFIFALADFYHEPGTWLFGGVYEVTDRSGEEYAVNLSDFAAPFIGRLRLGAPDKNCRNARLKMEGQYESLEVVEILPEPFAGRSFPGYEGIDLSFDEMETLVRNNRIDWKTALANAKGIYLITDLKTEKRYVGSAYGEGGIWARWCTYATTGHGGNVELQALLKEAGIHYCKTNFRFALLESRSIQTSDEQILTRETFWKQLLLTRGEKGLNRN